jgi:hypothetical protein
MALSIALGIRGKLDSYNPYIAIILALLGNQAMLSFVYNTRAYHLGGLVYLTTHRGVWFTPA